MIPSEYDKEELVDAMRVDKKKAGRVVRFALPVKIGEVRPGIALMTWRWLWRNEHENSGTAWT